MSTTTLRVITTLCTCGAPATHEIRYGDHTMACEACARILAMLRHPAGKAVAS